MLDHDNNPADPTSSLSRIARKAYWLTGGRRRKPPTTMTALLTMAHERNQVERARTEWNRQKKEALREHAARWASQPRGTSLMAWFVENGGGCSGGGGGGGGEARCAAAGDCGINDDDENERMAAGQVGTVAASAERPEDGGFDGDTERITERSVVDDDDTSDGTV